MELKDIFADILTLFAIVNPIGNLPVFLDITSKMSEKKRVTIINSASLIGLVILLVMSLFGQQLLYFVLHISLNDLKIAGGIILITLSIKSIFFTSFSTEEVRNSTAQEISAVPVAFPLLVGPGAIVTTIMVLQKGGLLMALEVVLGTFFLVWLALRFMVPLFRLIGKLGAKIISKIMYIFLASIAVKFIMTGIFNYNK